MIDNVGVGVGGDDSDSPRPIASYLLHQLVHGRLQSVGRQIGSIHAERCVNQDYILP